MSNEYIEELTKVIASRKESFPVRHMNIHLPRTQPFFLPTAPTPSRNPFMLTTTIWNVVFQRPDIFHFNNVKTLATFITKEKLPHEVHSEIGWRGYLIDKFV